MCVYTTLLCMCVYIYIYIYIALKKRAPCGYAATRKISWITESLTCHMLCIASCLCSEHTRSVLIMMIRTISSWVSNPRTTTYFISKRLLRFQIFRGPGPFFQIGQHMGPAPKPPCTQFDRNRSTT